MKELINWKLCNDWEDLPPGTWLVKLKGRREPYQVAYVYDNGERGITIVVGNYFHYDMGDILAYTAFEELNDDE